MVSLKYLRICAPLIVAASLLVQGCSTATYKQSAPVDRDELQALLVGDYIGQTDQGEVYHSLIPLHVPEFGGDIVYHHISMDSLRGSSAFQKIYEFDEMRQRMKSTVMLTKDEVYTDAQAMARRLGQLTEQELLRFPDGCQFKWMRSDDGFKAEVHADECSYESLAFGGSVSPEMEYQLSQNGLIIYEGIFSEDGNPLFPASRTDNLRAKPSSF